MTSFSFLDGNRGLSRRDFLKSGVSLALSCSALARAAEQVEASEKQAGRGTGLVYSDEYLRHTLGAQHPECADRLRSIMRRFENSGLLRQLKRISPVDFGDPMPFIKTIHSDEHIALVAREAFDEKICRLAVAGTLAAVDAVCKGEMRNAFCAIRPPGHHAMNSGEYGFCFYGNAAIAARYAQQRHNLRKIVIVDWDYHHGNGTEWAFYEDDTVLFFSTHALYAFPGTGHPSRTGKGKGEGYNINVPLPRGADDSMILEAFTTRLVPAVEKFKPDLVLISAGFDSRKDDLLGDFAVTDDGFAKLTELMASLAKTYAGSRLVSLLEGGYNLEGLARAAEVHVKALLAAS